MKVTNQQLRQLIKEEVAAALKEAGSDEVIGGAMAIMKNIGGLIDQIDGIVLSHPDLDSNESLRLDIESLSAAEQAVSTTLVTIQGEGGLSLKRV